MIVIIARLLRQKSATRWMIDARPGDILAWESRNPKTGTTGHVIFIASIPKREANGLIRVTIIDSTSLPHSNDSRKKGESGIGEGTMWFGVDESGRPVQSYWSKPAGDPKKIPIAIGRAMDQ
ncbi:MAG: hypothetical protein NTX50_13555 [Candidatus Sumerlaeota bacterium]|nr:hypothetical protein [Candidatus Sumerlaeota bacterium]